VINKQGETGGEFSVGPPSTDISLSVGQFVLYPGTLPGIERSTVGQYDQYRDMYLNALMLA